MSTIVRTLRNLRSIGLKVRQHEHINRIWTDVYHRNMAVKCRYAQTESISCDHDTDLVTFATVHRYGRHVQRSLEQELRYLGDTKAGTLIGTDRYGNKYYENLEQELPRRLKEVLRCKTLNGIMQSEQDGWTTKIANTIREHSLEPAIFVANSCTAHKSSQAGMRFCTAIAQSSS